MIQLARNEYTPFPADELTAQVLDELPEDSMGRVIVRLPDGYRPEGRSYEQSVDQRSGLRILIRRSACGAGCHCALTVKVPTHDGAVIPA